MNYNPNDFVGIYIEDNIEDNIEDDSIYDDMPSLISQTEYENICNMNKTIRYRCISEPNLNSASYNFEDEYENAMHKRKRVKSEPLEVLQENTNSTENYEDIILASNKHLFSENYSISEYNLLSRTECVNILVEICQQSFINKLQCPVLHCMCKLCDNVICN